MMTAVIWCCVFNLFFGPSHVRYMHLAGISLVTFFIQRLQTFLFLLRF